MIDAFQLLLRVRYSECDAQGIVFNARWAEYVDVAAGEFSRALFGAIDPTQTGTDWKLVKQTLEWKASGRYDDVLDVRVRCVRVGTTSFTLATEFRRHGDDSVLVTAETVYVLSIPRSVRSGACPIISGSRSSAARRASASIKQAFSVSCSHA